MWFLLFFAVFVLLMPLVMSQPGLNGARNELLESSFAQQRPVIHGQEMAASALRVVYRWGTSAMRGDGGTVEMDANWLCRTEQGLFVVAIGQAWREMGDIFYRKPRIRWIWRSISEERARQLLVATPEAYLEVFGSIPGASTHHDA